MSKGKYSILFSILKKSRSFNGNNTDEEVMKLAGIAKGTYYKNKHELFDERFGNE
jgi:hypothetical protein